MGLMLTVVEAAKEFEVPVHAVRWWLKNGELPHVVVGNKKALINREAMGEFLHGRPVQSAPVCINGVRRVS